SRREIGRLATWSASSAKTGHPVDCLYDDTTDTFWQSDGPQPHIIQILFPKKVSINMISLYMDYTLDESYTPSRITIKSGTGVHDIQQVVQLEFEEPQGWTNVALNEFGSGDALETYLIQVCILGCHQNGKDTHLRAVKVYAPYRTNMGEGEDGIAYTSKTFLSHGSIR
ncbi:Anaphase-promoting complex subunit 10, partial [Neolecta irregularis DAH-3]